MREGNEAWFHEAQAMESEQNEMARREALRRRFQEALRVSGPEGDKELRRVADENERFREDIGGNRIRDNALFILEVYASKAADVTRHREGQGEPPFPPAEAEVAISHLEEIRDEFQKENPDIGRVSTILNGFIAGRLEHFAATLGQRIDATIQRLMGRYQDDPAEAARLGVQGWTEADWRNKLLKDMGGAGLDSEARELSHIILRDTGEGLPPTKPVRIIRGVDALRERAEALGPDSDPLSPDAYKEPEA